MAASPRKIMPPEECHAFRNESLADRVAQHLESRIRAGVYPGELPGLRVLAEHYKVSRGVLREAIRKLETLNLVVLRNNRRAEIAPAVVAGVEQRSRHPAIA